MSTEKTLGKIKYC